MARKYSKKASAKVERAMKKRKSGTLKSGRSGRKVKSRKQAIAIGLSEARAAGARGAEEGREEGDEETDGEAESDEFISKSTSRHCGEAKRSEPSLRASEAIQLPTAQAGSLRFVLAMTAIRPNPPCDACAADRCGRLGGAAL